MSAPDIVKRARPPRKLIMAGIILAAIICVYLSVRNAVFKLFADSRPQIALGFVPKMGNAQAAAALARVLDANGAVDVTALSWARDAAVREPLSAVPFEIVGFHASAAGDDETARRLFNEVALRDPRSVIARYWLFDDAIRFEKYSTAIKQAGPLMALQPQAQMGVLTLMSALADVPAAKPALIAALRTQPSWRSDFVAALAASGNPETIEHAQELLRLIPASDPVARRFEQVAIVRGLVQARKYNEARDVWQRLVPQSSASADQVFDGDFADRQAPPPFAWNVPAINEGQAQRVQLSPSNKSGLEVDFSSDRTLLVAQQLVMPRPGRYRLSFAARKLETGTSSDALLNAGIRCLPSGSNVATDAFENLGKEMVLQSLDVNIPESCEAVSVRLWITPGISPGQESLQITDVNLKHL